MAVGSGGQPTPALIAPNFTHLDKVDNKSNQFFWKCNICGNTPASLGAKIQGQDDNLPKHVTNNCPDAPPKVQREACSFIAGKTQSAPTDSGSSSQDTLAVMLEAIVPVWKRKKQSLDDYINYPLTKEQIFKANSQLLYTNKEGSSATADKGQAQSPHSHPPRPKDISPKRNKKQRAAMSESDSESEDIDVAKATTSRKHSHKRGKQQCHKRKSSIAPEDVWAKAPQAEESDKEIVLSEPDDDESNGSGNGKQDNVEDRW
ncbi:hypothetical protein PAXRUDRAFT_27795 [Paxillus rubicundulus Ve08.2h10]|uniref:Uncharacterized protein n=1 Tax=Paxillus rubicundulus Ve08.2h10 TaxID=930991 RepID=A0A0D0DC39_9AGAM|nr:hypothetical protein PAXRUDRAFT_27795 [Paxillus rubicundulus Ve08.2h10]